MFSATDQHYLAHTYCILVKNALDWVCMYIKAQLVLGSPNHKLGKLKIKKIHVYRRSLIQAWNYSYCVTICHQIFTVLFEIVHSLY